MFGKEVESFFDEFQDATEETIRATTIKLWDSITLSSPVDEGRFRANWFASYGDTSKVTSDTDKSGQKTTARNRQDVLSQGDFTQFTLTNNLPYSERLEYGYSDQAPQGMVRVNVKRFKRLIEQEAKKKLPK